MSVSGRDPDALSGRRTIARASREKVTCEVLARIVERRARMTERRAHPLEHHPSFRAVIEAAPPLAELSLALKDNELVSQLALACGDLAEGFAAPLSSPKRLVAHRRAWAAVRDLDRKVMAIGRRKLAAQAVVKKAQRAIDRADVMVGALLPT